MNEKIETSLQVTQFLNLLKKTHKEKTSLADFKANAA